MTDKEKLNAIRAEVEEYINAARKAHTNITEGNFAHLLSFIDSLQEEPVKIKKGCKYRCLSDVINKDTGNTSFIGGKIYLAPQDNTLVSEENGWRCDTSENTSIFELVEEPVSEDLEDITQTITYNGEVYNRCYKDELDAFACKYPMSVPKTSKKYAKYSDVDLTIAIKAGAKWQKEQMMAKAFPVEIDSSRSDGRCILSGNFARFKTDERVKVIAIKED